MAGEAEGEGAPDRLGKGEAPEAALTVRLREPALAAEAVEVNGTAALAGAHFDLGDGSDRCGLRQTTLVALAPDLVLAREALLGVPGVELGCDRTPFQAAQQQAARVRKLLAPLRAHTITRWS